MNEKQWAVKNYMLIVKTLHGDPGDNISVIIKGTGGQTERLPLNNSQSYSKAFKDNQTDLFVLTSSVNLGQIVQVEFHPSINVKWKYNCVLIIEGNRVYRDVTWDHSLYSSTNRPTIVSVIEPSSTNAQESIYYAFVKTGNESCSKEYYPKLSLFGINDQYTEIDLKSTSHTHVPSTNNNFALEKHQFDIFQWQDCNIGSIERMRLQLHSSNKSTKHQWPIEWMFVIHHGYSFTGRIMLNRRVRIDRMIDIDLKEKTVLPTAGEHGDSSGISKEYDGNTISYEFLNKQSNATSDEIGRYYVIIRNMEGTKGDVYIEFHGDRLSSSGEERLSKCENYPEHPFDSKHTDLYHVKAVEVGDIRAVSIRLDQTHREHSLTLDSLFLVHNAIVYRFNLKYIILNKQQAKKQFIPLSQPQVPADKASYYIATHATDRVLSGANASFKVDLMGTKGMLGPIELKDSLTNADHAFEKECVDLFYIEDDNIGDLTSITITLESKGLASHLFSGAKCERIMVIKNGEYNSLWQLVGDLKSKEPKRVPLPIRSRQSIKEPSAQPTILTEYARATVPKQLTEPPPLKTEVQGYGETEPLVTNISKPSIGDHHQDKLTMATIEDHQKRHTFAPSLHEAQQNYRELRRLLKQFNGPVPNERKLTRKNKRGPSSYKSE